MSSYSVEFGDFYQFLKVRKGVLIRFMEGGSSNNTRCIEYNIKRMIKQERKGGKCEDKKFH